MWSHDLSVLILNHHSCVDELDQDIGVVLILLRFSLQLLELRGHFLGHSKLLLQILLSECNFLLFLLDLRLRASSLGANLEQVNADALGH